MAKFVLGEKAPKDEAEKALKKHVAGVYDGKFDVNFASDDGGNHICLYIEVDDASMPLDKFLRDAVWSAKWMGWRFLIVKCPHGYIDAILNSTASDDW